MIAYFAYGANMDRAAMTARCPSAVAIGCAALAGWESFISGDGYASVRPRAGRCVHGVLWRLLPGDLAALNAFESLDSGLYRRRMLPVRPMRGPDTHPCAALVFVGRRTKGRARPGYASVVAAAAQDWGMPPAAVAQTLGARHAGWSGLPAREPGALR